MAKEKGKSRKRIRDWQQRYHAGEEIEDLVPRQARIGAKGVKLGPGSFAGAEEILEDLPTTEAMVTGVFRRGAFVRVEKEQLFCGIAKTFRAPESTSPLVVGDMVTIAMTRPEHTDGQVESDRNRMDGMILSREPRETVLARPLPRSRKRRDKYDTDTFDKAIAANMDTLLIVSSTRQPPLREGLIERYLIIAERGELTPVLVINKIDLERPPRRVVSSFSRLDVRVIPTSAVSGKGLRKLTKALKDKRSILVGASGVGKTALVNALIPGTDAITRSVRSKDQRGRHTTSAATVYDLPRGGMIVDTPGIRELGLHLNASELPWYFPEFEQHASACKFNDCTHTHEPGCAVISAVQSGEIPPRRYQSYLHLLQSLGENLNV